MSKQSRVTHGGSHDSDDLTSTSADGKGAEG